MWFINPTRLVQVLLMSLALVMSGCATKSALEDDKGVSLDEKSMAILVLKVTNTHKLKYTPKPKRIYVTMKRTTENDPSLLILGIPKEPSQYESNTTSSYEEYLVSMRLKAGSYRMGNIGVESHKFPILASGFIPINVDFEIKPNQIVYLGRIEALRRKKEDGDYMAGSPIPLIDQAAGGYSNGTFDVEIVDKYEQDTGAFRNKYAVLKTSPIVKNILPAWHRPGKNKEKK